MNTYQLTFDTGCPSPVAGDLAGVKRLLAAVGYLWLNADTMQQSLEVDLAGAIVRGCYSFQTAKRLPRALDCEPVWTATSPLPYYLNGPCLALTVVDTDSNTRLNRLRRTIQVQGDIGVAWQQNGEADLGTYFTRAVQLCMHRGNRIWIGRVNATAQQGIYDSPMPLAFASVVLGGQLEQVAAVQQS